MHAEWLVRWKKFLLIYVPKKCQTTGILDKHGRNGKKDRNVSQNNRQKYFEETGLIKKT